MSNSTKAPGMGPETTAIAGIDAKETRFTKLARTQWLQILIVLIAIIVLFSIAAPESFPHWGNVRLIIQNASILAILAVGMTFVIVTAGIDLSIGSVLVFSGVVAAMVMRAMGGDGWGTAIVGIIAAILSGIAWGLFNGLIITKLKVPPLIVTLGSMGIALGLAQILTGGVDIREVPAVLTNSIGYGNVFGTVPVISVIALAVVVVGAIILHRTRFGLHTFAIGSNEESARRVGVKVDRRLIAVYTLTGGLTGLAGVLSLSQFSTTAIAGQTETNLNVITAVVIGGTSLFGGIGTIIGSIVGLFIPAVLQNGFVIMGVQPFWQQVAVGLVLIIAVYVDQVRRAQASRGGDAGVWRHLLARRRG